MVLTTDYAPTRSTGVLSCMFNFVPPILVELSKSWLATTNKWVSLSIDGNSNIFHVLAAIWATHVRFVTVPLSDSGVVLECTGLLLAQVPYMLVHSIRT